MSNRPNLARDLTRSQGDRFPADMKLRPRTFQHLAEPLENPDPNRLKGKRVGLIVLSSYPFDARPRRTADALVQCGMNVDYICIKEGNAPLSEKTNGINVIRVPIEHHRGGKLTYLYEYSAFILASAAILAARSLSRRYDLIYVNNMPDILVASALLPKLFGARVILDSHDPMPELMTTIFGRDQSSLLVRAIQRLEKWSIARVDHVFTPNFACQRILSSRSCRQEKVSVLMNSPDEKIFAFRPVSPRPSAESGRPFVVMYHGTLEKRNGIDLAIEAFARVRTRVPEAQLHVYGKETTFSENVMQSAREKGWDKNVFLHGQKTLEEIVTAIDGCDVGIIPNRINPFTNINTPVRIFEYLARGKPVIAPRTSGIQDYFADDSLLFFDPGNAEDLGREIEAVASHPKYALEVTERGQQVYKAHAWKQESRTLVRVVEKLLKLEIGH